MDELTDLIAQHFEKMLQWDIEHHKYLENGAILTIRQGEFFEKNWWAVFLEVQVDNEDHLKDIPPQHEWGDYALLSFQANGRGFILWAYESFNPMLMDLSRMFGMFLPTETEH